VSAVCELTIGRRIELLRRRRGLSRQAFAGLVGYSAEWLRQVEKGDRRLDKLTTLLRVAEVLRVEDVSSFIGIVVPPQRTRPGESTAPSAVRHALFHPAPPESATVDVDALCDRIEATWTGWQGATHRYSLMQRCLPPLLDQVSQLAADDGPQVQRITAQTYRLTAAYLRHVNDPPLALLASERALGAARRCGDDLVLAACEGGMASTLLLLGCAADAAEVCRRAVARLSPGVPTDPPEIVSVWGATQLIAAEIEAVRNDHLAAWELLDLAGKAAEVLGHDRNDLHSSFGPTDVGIHAVRVEIVLGRIRRALRLASKVDVSGAVTSERQARHYIALALAHAKERDAAAAAFALFQAEEACAQEIVFNDGAHQVVHTLLDLDDAAVRSHVWRLAERAKLL
jgi:transcriptional regulator with XRE-family HTH domain